MAYLEQLAARQPGMPRSPEVPGAPPTASRPSPANPPAVAGAPVGRPPLPPPSFPGGAGRALPVAPTAAAATPSPTQPGPAPGLQRQAAPTKPPMPPGQKAPGAPAEAAPALPAPLVQQFDHVPSLGELVDVPEGAQISTPFGTMDRSGKLTLSPEGEMKYKEAIVARRKKFGAHPFAADPNSPPPEVRLGGRMFNPFSASWVD